MSPKAISLFLGAAAVAEASATVSNDTPIATVIKLLDDLKAEVTSEGQTEAQTYDAFACFCKSTTSSKSTSILSGRDTIKTKSSTIASKTSTKEEKVDELKRRQQDHEDMSKELAEVEATYAKDKSEYEAKEADLSNAIRSLENAIQSMESSKPVFLAVREKVQQGLELAGVMNLITEPKRRELDAFLQTRTTVDPSDPVFKYHSQGIIDILNNLLVDFRNEKSEVDTEWGKTKQTYLDTSSGLNNKIAANSAQIDSLKDTIIPGLEGDIAQARADLVSAEDILKDDQAYLKDLTTLCETRANDWDQRSALRAQELSQLEGALKVLREDVEARDTQVNKRALIQKRVGLPSMMGIAAHIANPSFLQESSHQQGISALTEATQATQTRASAYLRSASERLHSQALSSMAVHIAADPFGKVKALIQHLIERLLRESTAEATKKGFCDEQLGKAKKDRDFRLEETQDLTQEIKALELKEDELEAEIQMLTEALGKLRADLQDATTDRESESEDNHETIKVAKKGLEGVQRAITILKVFYKQAAKATVLLQASPVDEDTAGAGFEGAYQGKQDSSKAIIGLLEVIETDFGRTVAVTTAAEKAAQADFVKFDRSSRADISGKSEKKTLDEEDLITTQDKLKANMQDLQTAQNLLDSALKTLEDLKPTCIDTGMSYADRVAKREEEIEALKVALCILDTDGVEASCSGASGQSPR